jgi:hypothetical protein
LPSRKSNWGMRRLVFNIGTSMLMKNQRLTRPRGVI